MSSAPRPYLSVVAPCFNEADGLPAFHARVASVCKKLGVAYEVVLVNDGSADETWSVMCRLAEVDPTVVAVNLSRNYGHQLALTAGLSMCRGERILILDADLQDPPELLLDMMRLMDQGADVVYGKRRRRAGETVVKRATASLFYRLINQLSEVAIPRDTGDFRLMSRRVLERFLAMPERHRFIRGMISWIGGRQVPLLYDRDARHAGESNYPLRKMLRFAVDGVTSFSSRPLKVATVLGLAVAAVGFFMFVYAIIGWLGGGTVTGWTSLMASIGLIGGIQLVVLGIIGEYLGRLYDQSKGRPLFFIDAVVGASSGELPAESEFGHRRANAA
jgi:dolichol-phosphate mannosyltransferase